VKEDRANGVEVALFYHALHEYGADHSAPTDKTNIFHSVFPAKVCAVSASQYPTGANSPPYKMHAKSQVKLINDGQAIRNTAYQRQYG
jgi:hypothetical protein